MDIYRQQLLDHYQNPRNFRLLEEPTHQAHATNPLCGDEIDIFLQVHDNQIQDISFQSQSCAITMASASLLTEKVKGLSVQQTKEITLDQLLELLGTPLTFSRRGCAQVVLTAIHKALNPNNE